MMSNQLLVQIIRAATATKHVLKFTSLGPANVGQIRRPDKRDDVSHRKSEPQRDGEAHEVGRAPHANHVESVLGEVLGVVADAILHPLSGVPCLAEHETLENVEGG